MPAQVPKAFVLEEKSDSGPCPVFAIYFFKIETRKIQMND